MRIVSLVPSATEIAWVLGLEGELVAVTHDCDFPASVRRLPRVTGTTIPAHVTSSEIDSLVRAAGERGESTFHVDVGALRAARPDAILGQTICRVCAVTIDQLPSDASFAPRTIRLTGESVEGILADIRRVAVELGVAERGERVVADLRARLDAVSRRVGRVSRPRVACLEWLDPLFNGGHWVPEQVALAGGIDVLGRPGERSRVVEWDEVADARPDVLALMPCGFGVERTLAEAAAVTSRPGFGDLPAARSGRVFAVNGSAYFSRPGPRVVDGVEVLAGLLHPDLFPAPLPDAAVPLLARPTPAMRTR